MAIITLEIANNASRELSQIAKKQIPFAIAKSLTDVAKQSQEEVRQQIRERFFIRKKAGGFESSVRIKPATKTNLTAEVYTFAAFAVLQQTGGTKTAKDGRLAIPSYRSINQVKKRSDANSPSSYLAGDAFKIRGRSGQEMIAKRNGKELKILYFLRNSANINKRFDMVETTKTIMLEKFKLIFQINVDLINPNFH